MHIPGLSYYLPLLLTHLLWLLCVAPFPGKQSTQHVAHLSCDLSDATPLLDDSNKNSTENSQKGEDSLIPSENQPDTSWVGPCQSQGKFPSPSSCTAPSLSDHTECKGQPQCLGPSCLLACKGAAPWGQGSRPAEIPALLPLPNSTCAWIHRSSCLQDRPLMTSGLTQLTALLLLQRPSSMFATTLFLSGLNSLSVYLASFLHPALCAGTSPWYRGSLWSVLDINHGDVGEFVSIFTGKKIKGFNCPCG